MQLLLGPYYRIYDEIIIISPTYRSQYKSVWSKLSPEGIIVYEELNEALMEHLLDRVSQSKGQTLLILDDLGCEFKNIAPRISNLLISNSRHYKLSIIYLAQRATQTPTILRSNCDNIICFATCSYIEVDLLWRLISKIPRRQFTEFFDRATSGKRGYFSATINNYGELHFYAKDFKTELK